MRAHRVPPSTHAVSVESKARMSPSTVLPTIRQNRDDRVLCGSCNALRDNGHHEHPVIGALCVWCSRVFDFGHDTQTGDPIRPTCPHCLEGDCPLHERLLDSLT